ncbi:hypothetical protein [Conexibacter sp. CPCC 206217]|uniref:hypothetical protein n=1 Tax=Conexibacter sp. CPCC 206217 TaxID=3064574 RepID=UPI002717E841|nr:hypothetical protein [Conexibacter sp. CPCC 206217]MDO8210915.1 hypothetical protein [Conexibacter sp. CPCC 206217]
MAVTLRAFTRAAGAEAAILLLDRGDGGQPFVVECPFEGLALLAEGEHTVHLDPDRLSADSLPLPPLNAAGPFELEAVREQIDAPLGPGVRHGISSEARGQAVAPDEIEQLARALRQLTSRFPERSVLSATFPTTDPDVPLHIAARTGDPLVLALGDDQFEMPPDWPA